MIIPALLLLAAADIRSGLDLGKAEGRCPAPLHGSIFLVDVEGLKDRKGNLKLELYPANDDDFLADDDILLRAGKAFARVEEPVPPSGAVRLCIRAPRPGLYALSLLHDRDRNHKFGLSVDGVGFTNNPKLGWSKPKGGTVGARIGSVPTRVTIVLNYRRGLFSVGPVGQ